MLAAKAARKGGFLLACGAEKVFNGSRRLVLHCSTDITLLLSNRRQVTSKLSYLGRNGYVRLRGAPAWDRSGGQIKCTVTIDYDDFEGKKLARLREMPGIIVHDTCTH